ISVALKQVARVLSGMTFQLRWWNDRVSDQLESWTIEKLKRCGLSPYPYFDPDIEHRVDDAMRRLRSALSKHPRSPSSQTITGLGGTHSVDFRSVTWNECSYSFTATQAACVKVLWVNFQKKTPDVHAATILEEAESSSTRLRDVFKRGTHPAWKKMIVPGST